LEERNAEAHYLYAANLGSAAQLKGVMASAWTVNQVTTHTRRALELNPNHPGALHMMGMLLDELPWIFGGDKTKALGYLKQAVMADPGYVHARLDLAKAYMKRNDADGARRELDAILVQPPAADESESDHRRRLEAFTLLDALPR
jgi:thioredoxin-like negative regulator of GroEL